MAPEQNILQQSVEQAAQTIASAIVTAGSVIACAILQAAAHPTQKDPALLAKEVARIRAALAAPQEAVAPSRKPN